MSSQQDNNNKGKDAGFIRRTLQILLKPSSRYSIALLMGGGVILGILFWGGFNWSLALTNTEAFCISCHEMDEPVYTELKKTIHYSNRSGVRATCPDCHVPRPWIYKMIRKVKASNELLHHFLGTVSTPEKFEAKRREMAQHVWDEMKSTDSRECRNCHQEASMKASSQSRRAQKRHKEGEQTNKTCIDCHKGIAHKNVWKEMQQEKEAAAGGDGFAGDM